MEQWRFTSADLDVAVNADGAQWCSLVHRAAGELLWQAGAAWPQYAPNLFPIVGQLTGDTLHAGGADYPMARHGFARRRRFAWLETRPGGCTLELRDDDQTRAQYPFAFRLRIDYALDGNRLAITYTLANPGSASLPASIGAHPAFRWPLADRIPKAAHRLTFSADEPAPIRRLTDGLLQTNGVASPISGRELALDDALFIDDAIVMDRLASTSVRYSAPGAPAITVGWDGFRELGLWSKPGADFVCIEPWYGYASPIGFDGPFEEKPGLLHVAPGSEVALAMTVTVTAAGS